MKALSLLALALLASTAALAEENVEPVKIIGLQFGCSGAPMAGGPEIRILNESKDGDRQTTFQLDIDDQDQLLIQNAERERMVLGRIDPGAKEKIRRACERGATSITPIRYTLFKDLRLFRYDEASSFRVAGRSDCTGAMMGMVFGMPSGLAHLTGCKHYAEHNVPKTDHYNAFVRGEKRVDMKNYNFNWRRLGIAQQVSDASEAQNEGEDSAGAQ